MRASLFSSPEVREDVRLDSLGLPPPGFIPLRKEQILNVTLALDPHGKDFRTKSGAQKAGLLYEKKTKEFLAREKPQAVLGPWFRYWTEDHPEDASGLPRGRLARFCQPDAIIFEKEILTIIEIKIRWCELAYWQLRHLYLPVCTSFYGPKVTRLICITRSVDPFVGVPQPVLIPNLDTYFALDRIGVLRFSGHEVAARAESEERAAGED